MARHKRRKQLSDIERTTTVDAFERLHRHLMIDCLNLVPGCSDFAAISHACEAIERAIRALTGNDPQWMMPAVSTAG